METILHDYRELLSGIDQWFQRCLETEGERIHCARGCSSCCRGLFDITLLDAFLLKRGFAQLPAAVRGVALGKALERLGQLQREWPGFRHPFILNHLPDHQWTEMPEDDETPCPLLSATGVCLVYDDRPMLCRLHGLPNIDISGESFADEWCTLNFVGADPLTLPGLRHEFRRTFERELALFAEFTAKLLGRPLRELDTFIPTALLIDFDGCDWPGLSRSLPAAGAG